jgi:ubiquinone biosynthesis monooxygenase Coq7
MPGEPRALSLADRLIQGVDQALRTVAAANIAVRPFPAAGLPEAPFDPATRRHAAALMRVNHAGEIAAQALYHGQALTARDSRVRRVLEDAAREETDHLAWCEQRVRELGSRTSVLAPAWYAGSWLIGALAGLAGDRASLGFVAETERQVVEHLQKHLSELPASDLRSREVVERMRDDEARHGAAASDSGARELPEAIRRLMRHTARLMTRTAYRI